MSDIQKTRERLREMIRGSIRTGRIVLSSGKVTDFYFDGRTVSLHQEGSILIARLMLAEIRKRPGVTAIGGPTSGADPIVSSIGVLAHQEKVPLGLFYVRKEPKGHGMQKCIEGPEIPDGAGVVLIDDVLTTGGSLVKALATVREETSARVLAAMTVVDREEGGRERLEKEGIEVISLFRRGDFVIPS